jgi:uncharacterized lipoprotein YmbA
MRTRIAVFTIIAAAVCLSGCSSNATAPATSQLPDLHTSQSSLDWDGTYALFLPSQWRLAELMGKQVEQEVGVRRLPSG